MIEVDSHPVLPTRAGLKMTVAAMQIALKVCAQRSNSLGSPPILEPCEHVLDLVALLIRLAISRGRHLSSARRLDGVEVKANALDVGLQASEQTELFRCLGNSHSAAVHGHGAQRTRVPQQLSFDRRRPRTRPLP